MEVMAALVALRYLPAKCNATLYSDSRYLIIGSKSAKRWESNDWKREDPKTKELNDVKNIDLWEEMLPLLAEHKIQFKKVLGHSGITENERCDQLAESAARKPDLTADWGYGADEVDESSSSSDLGWI
jgi:ribonuclease HI